MYTEENSKLISNIYNAKNRQDLSDVLELMGESGDPIFVYPILDGYRRYKHTTVGYFFLWCLSYLDYPELGERLNELLSSYDVQKEHIPMVLFFMAERHHFTPIADRMAGLYLETCLDADFHKDFDVSSVAVGCVLHYLREAGRMAEYEDRLRHFLLDQHLAWSGDKVMVLCFLMEGNQPRTIEFLLANYAERIRGTELERHMVLRLLFSQAPNARKLRELVLKNGQPRNVTLLEKHESLPRKRTSKVERPVYSNAGVVMKIGIMREQINKKTEMSEQFGFPLFPKNEMSIHQYQCIDDKQLFIDLCRGLVRVTRDVNPLVREHGLSAEESAMIMAGIKQKNHNWNTAQMLLYMHTHGVGADYELFGYRKLDELLDIIIEDDQGEGSFAILESYGLGELYRQERWHKVHGVLLNLYLQTLEALNEALSQYVSQDLSD